MQSIIHPNEWVQYTFQLQFVVQSKKDQDEAWTFVVPDQPLEISNLESVNSRRRDVTRGIQPKFVYESRFLNYYEPMKDQEVEENTNIDVVEEIEENYL